MATDQEQLAKTVQWLDDERRKDKQEIAALQERLASQAGENANLSRRIQQLDSDLTASNATLQRLAKIDEILGGYRKEMTKALEEVEQRRAEAEREDERLRKVEREGLNKSFAELRKGVEVAGRLEREAQSRKEEENRLSRLVAELQNKVLEFNRHLDERIRSITVLEEGRRQDAKRITELQTEHSELRKRIDENRGKLDVVEDLSRRVDVRVAELALAETERRSALSQWLDTQAVLQAERDRMLSDFRERVDAATKTMEEYGRRVDQYHETNREMKRSAESYQQAVELLERRIAEAAEMQRLAEERFRQDWAAFLADDQKRWTTHMLLRDEQWREHDRLNAKQLERLDTLEDQMAEALDLLRHWQAMDAQRLQSLLGLLRDMAAEYDQDFTQTR
jgi:DNA repair exonuclease SbcCD ATPase subunit